MDPDPEITRRIACGAYEVDTAAVAEAIVARLTEVLEPGEVGWPTVGVDDERPGTRAGDA